MTRSSGRWPRWTKTWAGGEFRVKSDAGGDNSVGCWFLSVWEMLDDDQVVVEK